MFSVPEEAVPKKRPSTPPTMPVRLTEPPVPTVSWLTP